MSTRILQVNSVVFQTLGEIFAREIECPTSYLISISKVETAPDLKTAKVHLSILPFSKSDEALVFVIRHKRVIQAEFAKRIELRFTPKLNFVIDDTQERVSEINRLIDEVDQP